MQEYAGIWWNMQEYNGSIRILKNMQEYFGIRRKAGIRRNMRAY